MRSAMRHPRLARSPEFTRAYRSVHRSNCGAHYHPAACTYARARTEHGNTEASARTRTRRGESQSACRSRGVKWQFHATLRSSSPAVRYECGTRCAPAHPRHPRGVRRRQAREGTGANSWAGNPSEPHARSLIALLFGLSPSPRPPPRPFRSAVTTGARWTTPLSPRLLLPANFPSSGSRFASRFDLASLIR